jgi:UDP-glucose 4-epimerase
VRAIITGGAEFVGSHAVCAHINAGNAVLVLDNPFVDHEVNLNLQAEFAGRVSLEEGL